MRSHELMWAATLLECLPSVEVLSVRVDTDSLPDYVVRDDFSSVPVVNIDVHAITQAAAAVLADALELREVEGREYDSNAFPGVYVYRTWRGWAAEGSHDAPCWVEVTGADLVAHDQHDVDDREAAA